MKEINMGNLLQNEAIYTCSPHLMNMAAPRTLRSMTKLANSPRQVGFNYNFVGI